MSHSFSGKISLTFQLAQTIRDQIIRGDLKAGDRLPPETSLAKEYGVSVITVQRALRELEAETLISRHRGKGTFVLHVPDHLTAPREHDVLSSIFLDEFESGTEILDWVLIDRPDHVAEFDPSVKQVSRLTRRVFRDGKPWSYAVIYLLREAAALLTREDIERYPMFRLMREKAGYALKDVDITLYAQVPPPEVRNGLDIDPLSPVMCFNGVLTDADDRVLNVLRIYFRGDRFSAHFHFNLENPAPAI